MREKISARRRRVPSNLSLAFCRNKMWKGVRESRPNRLVNNTRVVFFYRHVARLESTLAANYRERQQWQKTRALKH